EKSMCLRTAASCESRSSTRPDTEPAISGLKPARLTNSRLLEKVRKSEVIMRIHHCARSQIGGAHLGGFKTCQYIRAQAVNDVRAIPLVLPDPPGAQIAVTVVLLTAINIEGSPRRRPERKLRPAPCGSHRAGLAVDHAHALPQTADHARILAMEEGAGEVHARRGAYQPVDRKNSGGNRLP